MKNVKYQFYSQLNQAHNYYHKISGLDKSWTGSLARLANNIQIELFL